MTARALLTTAVAAMLISAACSTGGGGDGDGGGGPTPPSPTEVCEAECVPQFPEGEGPYYGIRACILCGACSTSCSGDSNPNCEGVVSVEDTCSEAFPECASCANDGCPWAQSPVDTTITGACAAEVTACTSTPACVTLYNCVVACLDPSSGPGGMGGTAGTGGMGGGAL